MTQPIGRTSRRRFVKLGATAFGLAAADRSGLSGLQPGAQQPSASGAPAVDGEFLTDAASREMAVDYGGFVHRVPRAVLRPASVDDVRRIVDYANSNRIKLTMNHILTPGAGVFD